MQIKEVNSSMCSHVAHDGEDLIITFAKSGKRYRYAGAGVHFDDCCKAASVGQYVNGFLKQNFTATQEHD